MPISDVNLPPRRMMSVTMAEVQCPNEEIFSATVLGLSTPTIVEAAPLDTRLIGALLLSLAEIPESIVNKGATRVPIWPCGPVIPCQSVQQINVPRISCSC